MGFVMCVMFGEQQARHPFRIPRSHLQRVREKDRRRCFRDGRGPEEATL